MPTVVISPDPLIQFVNTSGAPLSGGLLFTYAGGTSTPLNTYTDATGSTANANPTVLTTLGTAPQGIFLASATAYKFSLSPPGDVTNTNPIWTVDGITASFNGTMASQNASAVAIVGGTISGVTITALTLGVSGATSLSTLTVSNHAIFQGNVTVNGNLNLGSTSTLNANAIVATGSIEQSATGFGAFFLSNAVTAGQSAQYIMQQTGVDRWDIKKDATAETGSNSGSDFSIDRFDDGGNFIDAPVHIIRSTGNVNIQDGLTVNGGAVSIGGTGVNVNAPGLTINSTTFTIAVNSSLTFTGQTNYAASSTISMTNAPNNGGAVPRAYIQCTFNGTVGWIPFI